MPLYEYRCRKCGEISEFLLNPGEDQDRLMCKNCRATDLEKTLSVTNVSKYPSPKNGQTCCGSGGGCDRPKRCCES